MNDKGYKKGFESAKQTDNAEVRNSFLIKIITENLKVSVSNENFADIFEKAYWLLKQRKSYNTFQPELKKAVADIKETESKQQEVLYGNGYKKDFEVAKAGGEEERNSFIVKFITENLKISVNDKNIGELFEILYQRFLKSSTYQKFYESTKYLFGKEGKVDDEKQEVLYGHGVGDLNRVLKKNKNDLSVDEISEKENNEDLNYKLKKIMDKHLSESRIVAVKHYYYLNDIETDYNETFNKKVGKERIRQIKEMGVGKLKLVPEIHELKEYNR